MNSESLIQTIPQYSTLSATAARRANDKYFSVASYASSRGIVSTKQFDELRRLSRYESVVEMKAIVDSWVGTSSAPAPDPARPWAVGANWGESTRIKQTRGIYWTLRCECGQEFTVSTNDTTPDKLRKCKDCQDRESLAEAVTRVKQLADACQSGELQTVAGTMVLAQRMWERYRKFVRARVRGECRRYTYPNDHLVEDLEQMVWVRVAEKVSGYKDQGLKHGAMAWLKTVVFSVVNNHFRGQYNAIRDIRKNEALPDDDSRTMAYDKGYLPAKPTATADACNGDTDENGESDSSVIDRKAAFDAALGRAWRNECKII